MTAPYRRGYRTVGVAWNAGVGDLGTVACERHATMDSLYSRRSSLSLDATMFLVWLYEDIPEWELGKINLTGAH